VGVCNEHSSHGLRLQGNGSAQPMGEEGNPQFCHPACWDAIGLRSLLFSWSLVLLRVGALAVAAGVLGAVCAVAVLAQFLAFTNLSAHALLEQSRCRRSGTWRSQPPWRGEGEPYPVRSRAFVFRVVLACI
jgi:hypothetical protein